jgi:hypothetical protein
LPSAVTTGSPDACALAAMSWARSACATIAAAPLTSSAWSISGTAYR